MPRTERGIRYVTDKYINIVTSVLGVIIEREWKGEFIVFACIRVFGVQVVTVYCIIVLDFRILRLNSVTLTLFPAGAAILTAPERVITLGEIVSGKDVPETAIIFGGKLTLNFRKDGRTVAWLGILCISDKKPCMFRVSRMRSAG